MQWRRADQRDGERDDLFALALEGAGEAISHAKLKSLIRLCATSTQCFLGLAESAGRVVGYIGALRAESMLFHGEQIQVIGWYGQGGQRLLEMVEEWAQSLVIQRLVITVNPGKRYDRWARSRGMRCMRSYMKG